MWLLFLLLVPIVHLRAAAHRVEGRDLSFGDAFLTMLLSSLINGAISFVVGLVLLAMKVSETATDITEFVLLAFGVLILAGIISSRHELPYGRALRIAGAMLLMALGAGLVIGIVVFAVYGIPVR